VQCVGDPGAIEVNLTDDDRAATDTLVAPGELCRAACPGDGV